ncbi:MAG: isocitrate lyase/PEP mutase family protein [Terriglobia bacterium]
MDPNQLKIKAKAFRDLHHGPHILVLPNAWDAASARIFEQAGFSAIATTSAGVANSLGHPDGQRISRDEMLAAVKKIVAAVSVPVSADMEAGYGTTPEGVAETARAVIAAGAVGMNFEDGTGIREKPLEALELQIEKIRAVHAAATSLGVQFVLNARTDVYLVQAVEPSVRAGEAILRANAYREAGADCLFVPGVADKNTIGMLAREIRGPVNILAGPAAPNAAELEHLGVARMSTGSGPMRATLTLLQRIAQELRQTGSVAGFTQNSITHAEANRLFERVETR